MPNKKGVFFNYLLWQYDPVGLSWSNSAQFDNRVTALDAAYSLHLWADTSVLVLHHTSGPDADAVILRLGKYYAFLGLSS